MPPVAITFHQSRPSSSMSQTGRPRASSHDTKRTIAANPRVPSRSHPGQLLFSYTNAPSTTAIPASPSPPLSASSFSSAQVVSTKSRKSQPSTIPATKVAHLTPLLQPIVSRCLASKPRSPDKVTPSISPPTNGKKHSHLHPLRKSRSAQITWPVIQPYSRLTDLGNNRSVIPSRKEVARTGKLEEAKVRAKQDQVALARTKRKRIVGNGAAKRSASGRPVTRSTSPVKATESLPTIMREPASAESSPLPKPVGLKRTRSHGLLPISTMAANAIGTATVGVGSPLKAVMRPDGEEGEDPGRSRKRSRLSDEAESLVPPRSTRRAKTTSPTAKASPLPASEHVIPPSSYPTALDDSLPRTTARSLSVVPVSTKRAPSAGVRGVGMGRTASAGVEALGKERAKREVIPPGRLRDYVGAGTVA